MSQIHVNPMFALAYLVLRTLTLNTRFISGKGAIPGQTSRWGSDLPADPRRTASLQTIFTCTPAAILGTGTVLSASVRCSVRAKTEKPLIGNRCNLVGICLMANVKSGWISVRLDLGTLTSRAILIFLDGCIFEITDQKLI